MILFLVKQASKENLLSEIIENFQETSSKKIYLISDQDKNKIQFRRSPELIYGLRNFIGNAGTGLKFSKSRKSRN